MGIGPRIKERRLVHGLTQAQLAAAVEERSEIPTHQNEISRWENEVHAPGSDRLVALADSLGVHVRWLLTGEHETVAPTGTEG